MRIPFTGLVWAASRMIPYGMKSYILQHRFRTTPEEHRPSIVEAAASIDGKSLYNYSQDGSAGNGRGGGSSVGYS